VFNASRKNRDWMKTLIKYIFKESSSLAIVLTHSTITAEEVERFSSPKVDLLL